MPIFYLDTSAIVKWYHTEKGSDAVVELLGNPSPGDRFYTSFLSVLELSSGVLRLAKGGQIRETTANQILIRFRQDIREVYRIWPLDNDLVSSAILVVEQHRIRSADALHLATAMAIRAVAGDTEVVMVASDGELLDATSASGLATLDLRADNALERLAQIRGS